MGFIGIFILGILFAFGFTAGPATAMFLILAKEHNILFSGIIAGFGALLGDMLIFKFVRVEFAGEIKNLAKEKLFVYMRKHTPKFLKKSLAPFIGAIFIASPLPNEIGITLMAGSTKISLKFFSVICYLLNTAGIFAILLIGKAI